MIESCGPGEDIKQNTNDLPVLKHFTVNLRDSSYPAVGIRYYDGSNWNSSPVAMNNSDGWWKYSIDSYTEIGFYFQINGAWYPGNSSSSFYRASSTNIFIKDGILFDYDPVAGSKPADELVILTLNLHTYQEANAATKLNYVADLIAAADVDLIAFQECAQSNANAIVTNVKGYDIRSDNMVKLIVDRLKNLYGKDYKNYLWNWAHYGWSTWEEGVAVVGKAGYSMTAYESKYVSTGTTKSDINSRIAVYGAFQVTGFGLINFFSTHISYVDASNPQSTQTAQIQALKTFVNGKKTASPFATIICGDFNMGYNSAGYKIMMTNKDYTDAYLKVTAKGANDTSIVGGGRIDYQFVDTNSGIVPVSVQKVFVQIESYDTVFKQVSDHYGMLIRYRKK